MRVIGLAEKARVQSLLTLVDDELARELDAAVTSLWVAASDAAARLYEPVRGAVVQTITD